MNRLRATAILRNNLCQRVHPYTRITLAGTKKIFPVFAVRSFSLPADFIYSGTSIRAEVEDNLLALLLEDSDESSRSSGNVSQRVSMHKLLKDLKTTGDPQLALPIIKKYVTLEALDQKEFTLLIQVLDRCGDDVEVLRLYKLAEKQRDGVLVGNMALVAMLKAARLSPGSAVEGMKIYKSALGKTDLYPDLESSVIAANAAIYLLLSSPELNAANFEVGMGIYRNLITAGVQMKSLVSTHGLLIKLAGHCDTFSGAEELYRIYHSAPTTHQSAFLASVMISAAARTGHYDRCFEIHRDKFAKPRRLHNNKHNIRDAIGNSSGEDNIKDHTIDTNLDMKETLRQNVHVVSTMVRVGAITGRFAQALDVIDDWQKAQGQLTWHLCISMTQLICSLDQHLLELQSRQEHCHRKMASDSSDNRQEQDDVVLRIQEESQYLERRKSSLERRVLSVTLASFAKRTKSGKEVGCSDLNDMSTVPDEILVAMAPQLAAAGHLDRLFERVSLRTVCPTRGFSPRPMVTIVQKLADALSKQRAWRELCSLRERLRSYIEHAQSAASLPLLQHLYVGVLGTSTATLCECRQERRALTAVYDHLPLLLEDWSAGSAGSASGNLPLPLRIFLDACSMSQMRGAGTEDSWAVLDAVVAGIEQDLEHSLREEQGQGQGQEEVVRGGDAEMEVSANEKEDAIRGVDRELCGQFIRSVASYKESQ